ncbi:MAG: T9SS C-terminal target domain-containing protein, partial [Bacteroidota bacterium]
MKNILSTLLLLGLVGFAFGQTNPTKTIMGTAAGTGTTTWSSDTTYILDGFVFVNSGDTLTIEPGTIIKGLPGQGANASAFIVARGGYLDAQGQRANPIIFTASSDDTDNPIDVAPNQTGLWGGVIVLGNATTNTVPPEQAIEGIPTTEPRGLFGTIDPNGDGDYSDGVSDDTDNSGIMTYISVRHGGTNIGAGNEINGFTMGGVGSGTTIDHIEVIFNQDDGFEWFGGTVNCSHLAAAFCGDDSYDYDMGWRGNVQFAFAIQSPAAGSDRIGEHDGGTSPETGTPLATPQFFNVTYIGRGDTDGDRMLTFRDNAGGDYHNSIFVEQDRGVDFEILGNGSTDSYDRLVAGDLNIENNIWYNVADNDVNDIWTVSLGKYGTNGPDSLQARQDSLNDLAAGTSDVQARLLATGQEVADPGFLLDRDAFAKGLDPRPRAMEALMPGTSTALPNDPFFTSVSYKGAFSPEVSEFWLRRWTYMEQLGYFPDQLATITSGARPERVVLGTPAGTGTTTWSKDTTYILDGFVFVNGGDTLIIQAGTIIKGLPGQGADASALIVARGGYLDAQGTRAEPIIFTAASDDTDNPIDIAPNTQGLWGGVIVLGNATTNTVPPEQAIEGIPTTEARGLFGTID